MTDEEILDVLLEQERWWEKRVGEFQNELSRAERELLLVKRLKKILEERLEEKV